MRKLFHTLFSLVVLLFFIFGNTACAPSASAPANNTTQSNQPQPIPTLDQQYPTLNDAEIAAWNFYSSKFVINPLNMDLDVNTANFNPAVPGQGDINSINVPIILVDQEAAMYLQTAVTTNAIPSLTQSSQMTLAQIDSWAQNTLFHASNHFVGTLGANPYDLRATGSYMLQIIRGASTDGQIYFRAAQGQFSASYGFFSRIDGKLWVQMIDANTGAPITAYMLSGKGGDPATYNDAKALAEMARMIAKNGTVVTAESLPQNIKDAWLNSNQPPTYRIIWWALSYQIQRYAELSKIAITQAWQAFQSAVQPYANAVANWDIQPFFFIIIQDGNGNWYLPGMVPATSST